MSAVAEQVRAEERSAREQHRHMVRMAAEARRSRERVAAEAVRLRRKSLRVQLANAERDAAGYCREYSKALTAYRRCPDHREAEYGRALDRAFLWALAATDKARGLREELET